MEGSVWTWGWNSGRKCKSFMMLQGIGVGWGRRVPESMSLGHALDWEELAAGERPG